MPYDGGGITNNHVHEHPAYTYQMGLQALDSLVPSYDAKGLLAVSWTASPDIFENPTFVILHGGHGVGANSWFKARNLKEKFNANVLILDSFVSRGAKQNWARGSWADAKVRTFDVIAVGRWLRDRGTDPNKTYVMGGSQGGWTTLKAMSAEPRQIAEVKPLYAGGIAYYPVCDNYNENGNLRSGQRYVSLADKGYWGPVLIMSGKKDYATPIKGCQPNVVKYATRHVSFDRGTHGWDTRWREKDGTMNKDGSCRWSGNRNFQICYDEEHKNQMYDEIGKFTSQVK
jgi:dienelactone hydrolase